MSWSKNRPKDEGWSKEKKEEKIRQINGVLGMLSKDEDLHDDLRMPKVIAAIKHWTNEVRLPPEKAGKFQDDRRIMYVLQKFQILQAVCTEACIPVPLDHLLKRIPTLNSNITSVYFGLDEISSNTTNKLDKSPALKQTTPKSELIQRKPVASSATTAAKPSKVPTKDVSEREVDRIAVEGDALAQPSTIPSEILDMKASTENASGAAELSESSNVKKHKKSSIQKKSGFYVVGCMLLAVVPAMVVLYVISFKDNLLWWWKH